jgi:energy-coupling factor transporter ATP-binding protein EcfA2
LNRKNGAAVGVAGPRGSGKTELARAFTELQPRDPKSRTIPLMLWAPVKYDAQTFLLRLLKELCINILATGAVTPGDNGLIFTSRSAETGGWQVVIAIEARTDTRADVSKANLDSVTCWSQLWPDPGQTEQRLIEARPGDASRPMSTAPGSCWTGPARSSACRPYSRVTSYGASRRAPGPRAW